MPFSYPLMLDLAGRVVVIIGGGSVALRKASGVLEAGAGAVRAVGLSFVAGWPEPVERITADYLPGHLEGAGLVFAATDDAEVNRRVVRDARQRNILVSRADPEGDEIGDFSVPAVLRRGVVTVSVATGGSPALAARIRDELAGRFEPAWAEMAELHLELRSQVRQRLPEVERRRAVMRAMLEPAAFAALGQGGPEALRQWVMKRFPELEG